jgi:hypothetical protein
MALTAVTITGTYEGPTPGVAVKGSISFKLNQAMFLPDVAVVPPRNVTVTLDGFGQVPAGTQLYATDDVGVEPYGEVYYRAIFRFTGAATEIRYFTLSHLSPTFDLSDLSSLSTRPPVPPSVPTSWHTMTWAQAAALQWPQADSLGWQAEELPTVPTSTHTMTWPRVAALRWTDADSLSWQAA